MDTKWKNRKRAGSFIIFFLGVSLTLGGLAGLIKDRPGGTHIWQIEKILENDYQESGRFREYISGRLEDFLTMAAGGIPENMWEYYGGCYYGDGSISYGTGYAYESGYYPEEYAEKEAQIKSLEMELEELAEMQANYFEIPGEADGSREMDSGEPGGMTRQEMEDYQRELEEEINNLRRELESGTAAQDSYVSYGGKKLKEEEKKEIAEKYHEAIKGDKNLLYSVSNGGKTLYANTDALTPEGGKSLLEGKAADGTSLEDYNFFLYFDGEKVRIVRNGQEIDVYGDGYYRDSAGFHREGSGWYVPGYKNFPVDESIKKARVCIAVAREPVMYAEGVYTTGGSRLFDNSLYWLDYNCRSNRKELLWEVVCLAVGAALLALSFFLRKSRREALMGIAGFQAKIWVEGKALLFIGGLCIAAFIAVRSNYGYGLWEEIVMSYDYEYGMETLSAMGSEALRNLSPLFFIVIFWTVYFPVNDLKYNKGVWKHGLAEKLVRTFSEKNLSQPLSRRMAQRSAVVFIGAVVYAVFIIVLLIWGRAADRGADVWIGRSAVFWITILLTAVGAVILMTAAYLTGRKNMETAKDLEVLARNVDEIHGGNYSDIGGEFSGHDLESIMKQLEDIRHGMEKAVDEQMKSERMKVELIANVSHDIKTPLTSIISYVQFLKQEEGLPEHVRDYIRILDEKSQRLKNMVQDVFAVSKAASGELPVHMERLDFGKLLRQTMADMEEEISGSEVSFRTEIPESPVMIMADGQRIYRVFQNLFQNAIKYSLDGSRVYVTLKADGGLAVASVKNTSHLELDKEKDFTERFARGDESRTDGGSGLGLSIARSFTEACGGTFSWETDADLFVVRVSFNTV